MNNRIKNKVTRKLLSSLLDSNLSKSELIEFCDSILSGTNYMHEFASNLRHQLDNNHLFGTDFLDEDEINIEIEEIYSEIKIQRLSKVEIIHRMSMYDTLFIEKNKIRNKPIKSILKEFLLSSNEDVWHHFKESIIGDDYFRSMRPGM